MAFCGHGRAVAAGLMGVAAWLGVAMTAGAAPMLDGETVRAQWLFPDVSTAFQTEDVVVGPGLEIPDIAGGFDVDLSDTQIHFSNLTASQGYSSGTFNGWLFFDLNSVIDAFGSVAINPATNMVGFNASRISFDADNIWVDFVGLTGDSSTVVVLDIGPAVVPEPSTALLLAAGTALLAGLRRARERGWR
jgi:hypothetical protein